MIEDQRDSSASPLIVTTALESTWDASRPIVWAGEWCRRHSRRSAWEPIGGATIPNQWTPRHADKAVADTRRLVPVRDRLVAALGQRLSTRNGLPASDDFWRIVLGGWALFYVTELFDRYETATTIRGLYPDAPVTAPVLGALWTANDTLEQAIAFSTDGYNLQVFARVFEELGSPLENSGEAFGPTVDATRPGVSPLALLLRLVARIRRGKVVPHRLSMFPRSSQYALALRTAGASLPLPYIPIPRTPVDVQSRALLADLDLGDEEFDRILSRLVARDLPAAFFEGMPAMLQLARRRYPAHCSAIFSATGWYHEEVFKVWAALAAEEGTRLLGTQHGGNYGIDAVNASEDFELSIVDRYYTWGWHREDVTTATKVMPATKLTSVAPHASGTPHGALLISTVTPRYGLRADAWSRAYLEWQDRFAAALSPDVRRSIRVRLHRDDSGWDMAERWAARAPEAHIEGWDVPFDESIARAGVVLCDHLSTTYAQALAAGRPTVLFWDPETERIRDSARGVFEGLRRAGVLLDTPELAAQTVATVLADPDAWMADDARRAAIARFVERFAFNTPDAERRWAREFRDLAR